MLAISAPDALDEYLRAVRQICDERGILLVMDEIQTGMGRTGRFLAIEHWNVEADVVLLPKPTLEDVFLTQGGLQ